MAGVQISDWAMVESMPGQIDMEDRVLPMHLAPPLHVTGGSKGTVDCYILAPVPPQDRCQSQVEYNTALGSPTPDFFSRFTPEAFAYPLSGHKAVADWWW